jgi:hypothetical protein
MFITFIYKLTPTQNNKKIKKNEKELVLIKSFNGDDL